MWSSLIYREKLHLNLSHPTIPSPPPGAVRYVDEAKMKKCILPCTPLAVVKIMEHVGIYDESLPVGDRLQGKLAVGTQQPPAPRAPAPRPTACLYNSSVFQVCILSIVSWLCRTGRRRSCRWGWLKSARCRSVFGFFFGTKRRLRAISSDWVQGALRATGPLKHIYGGGGTFGPMLSAATSWAAVSA